MTGRGRRTRNALVAGIALCLAHVTVAYFSSAPLKQAGIRPLYEGPCPPSACPPCPPTCPSFPVVTPQGAPSLPAGGTTRPTPQSPPRASTTVVGPDGGTISSSDGTLRITVPPGALRASTSVSFEPASSLPPPPPGEVTATTPWHLSASIGGQSVTVFDRVVTMTFSFFGDAPRFIAYWDGQEWVNFDTKVNDQAGTATITSAHLSIFVGFASANISPVVSPSFPVALVVIIAILLAAIGSATFVVRSQTSAPRRTPPP